MVGAKIKCLVQENPLKSFNLFFSALFSPYKKISVPIEYRIS